MSSWDVKIGEAVGYAIGAVIFGPTTVLARRERRTLRRAFWDWLDGVDTTRLTPRAKGVTRVSGALRGGAEPIPFEAELDPFMKRASVDVSISLGRDVTIDLSKARWILAGVKLRLAPAIASIGVIRVDATNLDAEAAGEIAHEVAQTPLASLETFTLDLRRDVVQLDLLAPRDAETWRAIETSLVTLAESWSRRWTSYR